MHPSTPALKRAIACFPSQAEFVRALSAYSPRRPVSAPAVSQWKHKGVPDFRCAAIEAITRGKVRVEALRGDLLWERDRRGRVKGWWTPVRPPAGRRR